MICDLQIVDPDFSGFLEKLMDLPPSVQMKSLVMIALLQILLADTQNVAESIFFFHIWENKELI